MAPIRLPLFLLALLPAAPAAVASPPASDQDQIICKKVERPASRFQRRLCGTREQWDQLAEQHKAMYNEVQNRPVVMIGR